MTLSSGQPLLPDQTSLEQQNRDLGFGSVLSRQRQLRLLNRDGSFNVFRQQPKWWRRLASYHFLLNMTWPRFFAVVFASFVAINTVFATAYYLCGPGAVQGDVGVPYAFLRCFFFSVDTFATIGYGNLSPSGVVAHVLVSIESLFGLMTFAIATGLVFAKFARPVANIIYSKHAIIAPYRGIMGFEFRIINGSHNQLIDVEARVVLTRFEDNAGSPQRKYYQLALERDRVSFFPAAWTVVHPIDNASPLYGWTHDELVGSGAEFLILLTATDETFSQTVQSRSSYTSEEVVWGVRFASLFQDVDRVLTVDMQRFDALEPAS
jgi:inward rectifier potassium channel